MSENQTLYRKYRPKKFTDVIGQDHIVTTLSNALKTNRLGHAYIFTGPRGTGKTSIARLFAMAINCEKREKFTPAAKNVCESFATGKAIDLIEIDAASHTGVDNIRELRETIAITPTEAPFKVYIIDEVHMLSTGAFNALLKTLEEPPAHAIFILATTDIHKVPDTILSRCQRFDFARIGLTDITTKIHTIAKAEKIKIAEEAAQMIAIAANGGMRDAESLLAQVFALEDKSVTEKEVAEILGTTTQEDIYKTIEAFVKKDVNSAIASIGNVSSSGYNLNAFSKSLIVKLRALMFYTLASDESKTDTLSLLAVTKSEQGKLRELASMSTPADVVTMITECEKAAPAINSATIPELPLEIAALTICGHTQKGNPNEKSSTESKKKETPTIKPVEEPIKKTTSIANHPKPDSGSTKKTTANPLKKNEGATEANQEIETPKSSDAATTDELPSGKIALTTIQEKWHEVIAALQADNPSLASIASNYEPFRLHENNITLMVKYDLHKDKLMEGANKLTLSTILATIFDMPLGIQAEKESPKNDKNDPAEVLKKAQALLGGTVVEG